MVLKTKKEEKKVDPNDEIMFYNLTVCYKNTFLWRTDRFTTDFVGKNLYKLEEFP